MNQNTNHKKPIRPIITNAVCQPHCSAIHGTVSGARMAPIVVPELNIPTASDLSFLGKYSAVALIAAGKFPHSPIAKNDLAKMKPSTEAGIAESPIHPRAVLKLLPIGIACA